jgi:hypothetical protein
LKYLEAIKLWFRDKYRRTAVSAVYGGPIEIWKIEEINGSQFSKRAARENGL